MGWWLYYCLYIIIHAKDNLFFEKGDEGCEAYIRTCLDTNCEFDMEGLLIEEKAMTSEQLQCDLSIESLQMLDASSSIEKIPLDIDLILNTSKKAVKFLRAPKHVQETSRDAVVHSFVGCLMMMLENFVDPVVPYAFHYACVLEGYHSLAATKHIISKFPTEHYHMFMYLVLFLKEFIDLYQGDGEVTIDTIATRFAPVILRTPEEVCDVTIPGKMTIIVDGYKQVIVRTQYTVKRKMFLVHFLDKSNTARHNAPPPLLAK